MLILLTLIGFHIAGGIITFLIVDLGFSNSNPSFAFIGLVIAFAFRVMIAVFWELYWATKLMEWVDNERQLL